MEIKRAAELTVCAILKEALTTLKFFASKGDTAVPAPMPPFGTVIIDQARRTTQTEETSILSGKVQWITRADSTTADVHAETVQSIYNVMNDFDSGYDPNTKIIVHGLDVLSTEEYNDEARQAHGDIIQFVMGVTDVS